MDNPEVNPHLDYIKANEGRLSRVTDSIENTLGDTSNIDWQLTLTYSETNNIETDVSIMPPITEQYLEHTNGDIESAEKFA